MGNTNAERTHAHPHHGHNPNEARPPNQTRRKSNESRKSMAQDILKSEVWPATLSSPPASPAQRERKISTVKMEREHVFLFSGLAVSLYLSLSISLSLSESIWVALSLVSSCSPSLTTTETHD